MLIIICATSSSFDNTIIIAVVVYKAVFYLAIYGKTGRLPIVTQCFLHGFLEIGNKSFPIWLFINPLYLTFDWLSTVLV